MNGVTIYPSSFEPDDIAALLEIPAAREPLVAWWVRHMGEDIWGPLWGPWVPYLMEEGWSENVVRPLVELGPSRVQVRLGDADDMADEHTQAGFPGEEDEDAVEYPPEPEPEPVAIVEVKLAELPEGGLFTPELQEI